MRYLKSYLEESYDEPLSTYSRNHALSGGGCLACRTAEPRLPRTVASPPRKTPFGDGSGLRTTGRSEWDRVSLRASVFDKTPFVDGLPPPVRPGRTADAPFRSLSRGPLLEPNSVANAGCHAPRNSEGVVPLSRGPASPSENSGGATRRDQIQGTAHPLGRLGHDMGVDHRRAHIVVAEQLLHGADVLAHLQ